MKKTIIAVFLLSAFMVSCTTTPKGTTEFLHNDDDVMVYRFYYDDGKYIFISKFKDEQHIETTTWEETEGSGKSRHTVTKGNIQIK